MSRAGRWLHALLLLAFTAGLLFPIVWAVLSSLKTEAELFGSPGLLPAEPTLRHYAALARERDFLVPIRNSLIVAGGTTVISLLIGTLAAYALARLRIRGKGIIMGLILAVSMFPQISIVSPLYLLLREAGLLDTYPGLVLPYMTFALPLTVWFLTGYFRQLPADLEQAALVDGAGRLTVLREIVVPLALPALATTAILTFIYCWNEFLFALSFTVDSDMHTVPVAVALFRGRYQVPWGQVLAATAVSTAPVAAAVLVFQRRIVSGLTAGAVRG
jgi:ABC-type glycerol-3-phosphate transport system permease component